MKIEPTTLIILGVLCVALGFIANILLGMLREDVGPEGVPDESIDSAPPGGRKGKYTPVVRLWRERQSGRLIVEVDGKSLVSPEPLNEIQRERLERVARDFRAFLGMGLVGRASASEASPDVDAVPVQPPAAMPPVSQATGAAHSPADQPVRVNEASAGTPVVTPAPAPVVYTPPIAPPPTPPPSPRPRVTPPVRSTGGKSKGEPSPIEEAAATVSANRSIVAQIEDILQDMLAGGPYANRGIHLNEDPIRGVIVSDGNQRYEGIDAVADPEVKAIIRAAVAEWEKNQA